MKILIGEICTHTCAHATAQQVRSCTPLHGCVKWGNISMCLHFLWLFNTVAVNHKKKNKNTNQNLGRPKYAIDFNVCPFPSFAHFPIRLHPAALSLTFLGFFLTGSKVGNVCSGRRQHAHMANIRRGRPDFLTTLDHSSPLSSVLF